MILNNTYLRSDRHRSQSHASSTVRPQSAAAELPNMDEHRITSRSETCPNRISIGSFHTCDNKIDEYFLDRVRRGSHAPPDNGQPMHMRLHRDYPDTASRDLHAKSSYVLFGTASSNRQQHVPQYQRVRIRHSLVITPADKFTTDRPQRTRKTPRMCIVYAKAHTRAGAKTSGTMPKSNVDHVFFCSICLSAQFSCLLVCTQNHIPAHV